MAYDLQIFTENIDPEAVHLVYELAAQAAAAIRRLAAGWDTVLDTHDTAIAALLGWPIHRMG